MVDISISNIELFIRIFDFFVFINNDEEILIVFGEGFFIESFVKFDFVFGDSIGGS